MRAGYLYVLVNSSMPGLVKVGKTTRLPSERAAELSGVTGVATPFIVAFEQYFDDCDQAESCAHAELERRGMRQQNNREFFRASTNDVIRVIINLPGISEPSSDSASDSISTSDAIPWAGILEEADDYYYGFGDVIQDNREALKLYMDAARLGSAIAYERIGDMHDVGDGVPENRDKAIDSYKEGARRGNYHCYARMAQIFMRENNIENAQKSWKQFFSQKRLSVDDTQSRNFPQSFVYACCSYITFLAKFSLADQNDLASEGNIVRRDVILEACKRAMDIRLSPGVRSEAMVAYQWAREYISADTGLEPRGFWSRVKSAFSS